MEEAILAELYFRDVKSKSSGMHTHESGIALQFGIVTGPPDYGLHHRYESIVVKLR